MTDNKFWGHAIITTKDDLVRALGEPTKSGDAKERSRSVWELYSTHGGKFTVYDLRSREYYDHEEQEFRIAAKDAGSSHYCYLDLTASLIRANPPK